MSKTRLISRIDIKNEHVIKGIQFDGLRKLGDPNHFAKKYYEAGADEILLMDAVASLYDRNNLSNIIEKACEEVFVPITVGGGIRNISDIKAALHAGASKVAINTQAVKEPNFITRASRIFGNQCIVASIEAKRIGEKWEAYIDNGREKTGRDVIDWACKLQSLGAGEIILTSVDKEGTRSGFDVDLIERMKGKLKIPLVVAGGAGNIEHIRDLCSNCEFNAIAVASILHYNLVTIQQIKKEMSSSGLRVRQ